jgi:hypothetical protein
MRPFRLHIFGHVNEHITCPFLIPFAAGLQARVTFNPINLV